MQWENLVGTIITGFQLERDSITFLTADGPLRFKAEGDEGSVTWIDAVNDLNAFPGQVLEAFRSGNPASLPDNPPAGTFAENIPWASDFYKIRTVRGYLDLTLYNDNIGYYGGWLQFVR